ncbi:survival motor neuron interacting protein 1-domain-containing protein [Melampsora americana]|nr:survival motor neuron interacting protein 1-domain-containing protein [Melampsora americana]
MSQNQSTSSVNGQQADFYDDYDSEMNSHADPAEGGYEEDDHEEWRNEDEEYVEEEEGAEEMFPIGYSIEFTPPRFDGNDEGRSSDAPRGGLGSQALPVPDNMRSDWDGIPQDGAEYLFTVRQEAQSRPRVVAKENPYALKSRPRKSRSTTPSGNPGSSSSVNVAWRAQFAFRFNNMRKSLQDQEPDNWSMDNTYLNTPPANDESNWRIFIFGKKVVSSSGDPTLIEYVGAKPPIPTFLKALDQVTVVAILTHYTGWIEERLDSLMALIEHHNETPKNDPGVNTTHEITLLSAHDGSWLLGLLSILDSVLTAQDIYRLRALARACKRVAQIADAASKQAVSQDDSSYHEAAAGWMVVAAIADVWGQKDLWDD